MPGANTSNQPATKPQKSRKIAYSIIILLIIIVAVYIYYSRFIVKMDKETEDDGKINKKNTEVKSNHIDEDAELKRLTNYINNRGGKNEQLPNSNTRAR